MLHGLGDCTPERNCGCIRLLASKEMIEVRRLYAERWAEREGLNEETSALISRQADLLDALARLTRENEALRANVAAVQALVDSNPDHADTCGSMLTPGAGYPCSCWQTDLRAALAGPVADMSDVDVCNGDAGCTSTLHVHGCFADAAGPCTDLDEHQPSEQED